MVPSIELTERSSRTSVSFENSWYVRGRTPASCGFSSSMAAMASLIALPMFSPSGSCEKIREPGLVRQVEDAAALVVGLADGPAAAAPAGEIGLRLGEAAVGELEEDEAQDRNRVLAGLEVRVGSELVGGVPEVGGDLVDVDFLCGVCGHRSDYRQC